MDRRQLLGKLARLNAQLADSMVLGGDAEHRRRLVDEIYETRGRLGVLLEGLDEQAGDLMFEMKPPSPTDCEPLQ